jgi:hypothetical protein
MNNINKITDHISEHAAKGRETIREITATSQNAQVIEIAGLASMYLDYIQECMTVIDCLTELVLKPAHKRIFVVDERPVDIQLIRELETSGNVVVCNSINTQTGLPTMPDLPSMPAFPIVPLKALHQIIPSKPGQEQRRERRKRERKIKK